MNLDCDSNQKKLLNVFDKYEKDKNFDCFINNIKSFIFDYNNINNIYSIDKNDKIIDKKNNLLNENDERIKNFLFIKNLYCNNENNGFYLPLTHFNIKSFSNKDINEGGYEIIKFWRKVSKEVLVNKILGFPLSLTISTSYFTNSCFKNNEKGFFLYFQKYNKYKKTAIYNNLISKSPSKNDEILFQKIFIFYTLYNENMSSDNYIFEEINLKVITIFNFRIKDMIFKIPLTTIIILSSSVILINQKESINSYLDTLEFYDLEEKRQNHYDNFYELFYDLFEKYLSKEILNFKSIINICEYSKEIKNNLIPGNLYIVKKDNEYNTKISQFFNYCYILNIINQFVKIIIFYEATSQNNITTITYPELSIESCKFYKVEISELLNIQNLIGDWKKY